MKDLVISQTSKTPEVSFATNGELKIAGNSYPENATEFYTPVLNWLDQFLEIHSSSITLNVDLNYTSTASTKAILIIVNKIRVLAKSSINVSWLYEIGDDEMYTMGEDIAALTNLKFDFVEKQ